MNTQPTIAAIASPAGAGATATIKISGKDALPVADAIFVSPSCKKLAQQRPYTMHYGKIVYQEQFLDEVMAAVLRAPHSYTGEDVVEIYCHGSVYIQRCILQALIDSGARLAQAGEFTQRAFLNGKIDLSQAEAVADLIASTSEAAHRIAVQQMRGVYSEQIQKLRARLIDFVSLIELELDFSEEDLEFADRSTMTVLMQEITGIINRLTASFAAGNAIKEGIPAVICGKPNAGKSTLFNVLVNEQRALVSPLAGTTRDSIEATAVIGGMLFRFIDTAGLRKSSDTLENMSIERSRAKIEQSHIVLWVVECEQSPATIANDVSKICVDKNKILILLLNKTDLLPASEIGDRVNILQSFIGADIAVIPVSGKSGNGLQALMEELLNAAVIPHTAGGDCIVSSVRHYDALMRANRSLSLAQNAINDGSSSEIIACELRGATDALSEITGEISTDEVLGNIFSRFCIGK